MKKIVAILLALALCLGTAFAAEVSEITWADVADAAAQIDPNGQIWTLNGINCAVWIPEVLKYVELSQEEIDAGYLAYWATEDNTAAMGVQYGNVDDLSLDEYAAMLAEMGISDIETGYVNGLYCVTYSYTNEEGISSNVVAFALEGDNIVEFSFTAGDEGYEAVASIIAASIQPIE